MGKKDSTAVRSTPADLIIRDERDLFDQAMAEQTEQRIQHSEVKEQVDLGTPTIPDYGVHRIWLKSNQFHWHIRCEACTEWTCLDVDFPECIKYDEKDRAFRACKKCGREIDPSNGQWVAKYPDRWNKKEPELGICGYWPTQLIASEKYLDLNALMTRYNDPDRDIGEFYNAVLGMPYIAAENRLTVSDVYRCCKQYKMPMTSAGPCAMGIDIGKVKHIVIGCKTANGQYSILKIQELSDWADIAELAYRFNVRSTVIDAMPFTDMAKQYRKAHAGTFLCWYSDALQHDAVWDIKEGVVRVQRTELCDETHRLVTSGNLELPARGTMVDKFGIQCCNIAKILQENPDTGTKKYRYRKLGEDHFRHALNYFKLAAGRIGIVDKGRFAPRQEVADNSYDRLAIGVS
jgi:hypothetical protein